MILRREFNPASEGITSKNKAKIVYFKLPHKKRRHQEKEEGGGERGGRGGGREKEEDEEEEKEGSGGGDISCMLQRSVAQESQLPWCEMLKQPHGETAGC